MSARALALRVALALAVLLAGGRLLASFYAEWAWYHAMGASHLWRVRLANLALLRGTAALVAAAFVFINLYAVRQSVRSVALPRRVGDLEFAEAVSGRRLTTLVVVLSLASGVLLAIPADDWTLLGLARYGAPFGESDPYFQFDLAFFVDWLPLEAAAHRWALAALLLGASLVAMLYALTGSLGWHGGRLHVSAYVRRHLFVLGAVLLTLVAWGYRLDMFGLLSAGSGPHGAFTAVDHLVAIPANIVLALAALSAAALVVWAGWTGQLRVAFGVVTVVLALSLLLRQVLPAVVTTFVPALGGEARSRAYTATRVAYTRRAYDVARIRTGDAAAAGSAIDEAARGTSAWDPVALGRVVAGTAPGRIVGEMGWRAESGALWAVVVERPERPGSPLDGGWSARRVPAWASEPTRVVLTEPATADTASRRPLPVALVYDGASGTVVVADTMHRIAGPRLGSRLARVAYAWSEQNLRLLFADLPEPTPTLVAHRDVRERVDALAPFFAQGTGVSPLVVADTLFWALDLYTASRSYPLSESAALGGEPVTYLRHAAVALVNAHAGGVRFVLDSAPDPVAAGWMVRFPELFTARTALAPEVATALPPAVDGVVAAAAAYARYGGRGERPPQGRLAGGSGADSLLTHGDVAMFVSDTPDVTAWAVAVLDSAERVRGVLTARGGAHPALSFTGRGAPGQRWSRVVDVLQQAADSAGGTARDARVVRGRVRAVPLRSELAFLQTTYAWRADAPPAITTVAVLDGTGARAAPTLAGALEALPAARTVRASTPEFRARVAGLYEAMRGALRAGDWRRFGAAFDTLGLLLRNASR